MRIVIAGGHGKIALLLAELLTGRGHEVAAFIRNPDHADDVAKTSAEPVLLDLEHADPADFSEAVKGADAVVFAAGAGPGSSIERKYSVDLGGSVRLADAAEHAGVRRFAQISSMGAGEAPTPGTSEVWAAYIDAKTRAEDDLRARDLDWIILRPGRLVDTAGTGLVTLVAPPAGPGDVPRADVAATLAELLDTPAVSGSANSGAANSGISGLTLELRSGDTLISEAVAALRG